MSESCYHCGDKIFGAPIVLKEREFCCEGCKNVFLLLEEGNLGDFYRYEKNPGLKPSTSRNDKYKFLDIADIQSRYIRFEHEGTVRVVLSLPSIHCTSCIYLLENAHKIQAGIKSCQVHFAKKEASILFNINELPFSELALFLDRIGYPPNFEQKKADKSIINKRFLLKMGVAGFAFGSIMLWSAPEYVGIENDNPAFRNFSAYLAFIVSLPVLIFSAGEYFVSAYKAVRSRYLNLDVPITIGIIALYAQSSYAIFSHQGPGYMDSFAGFIFFLLIGKWFQSLSYRSLSFDRDYTAYFPVASTRLEGEMEDIVAIEKLVIGDSILVRNEEIIPCDAVLVSDRAMVDYSFVTGESEPVEILRGHTVYAGGKMLGNRSTLQVKATTDRSHLTQLWNEAINKSEENNLVRYQDRIAQYFLVALLIIAGTSSIAWWFVEPSLIVKVVVSILIVACPCALALSAPFTLGNLMQVMGKSGLYLKNTSVIEAMGVITDIIFDKTGTLTDPTRYEIIETFPKLSIEMEQVLSEMTKGSTHPLSQALHRKFGSRNSMSLSAFEELKGDGIKAVFESSEFRLGNAKFCGISSSEGGVFFTRNGELLQHFQFKSTFRPGLKELVSSLSDYRLHVLSGDAATDLDALKAIGFQEENIYFQLKPKDKFDFIERLKAGGAKVMMVGDGLNDTGALGSAHVGVAISEDMFRFTPSSDAILDASSLSKLKNFLQSVSYGKLVLRSCLGFSLFYNSIGLSFAISATLTPFVAAILMPVSSVSVVLLSTLMVRLKYPKGV